MLKRTQSITMNTTIVAILQYYNISIPGLLEQKPGQDLDLTVFLDINLAMLDQIAGIRERFVTY